MKLLLVALVGIACTASVFSQQVNRRQGQQGCTTPENYYGTCVALSYCPQVANVFLSTNQQNAQRYIFALQRSCGTRSVNRDPIVCCTRPQTNFRPPFVNTEPNPIFPTEPSTQPPFVQPTTSRITRNPANPFLPTQTVATQPPTPVTPASSAPLIDNKATTCRGPDTRVGDCIELKECQVLVNELYTKPNDQSFANYLRASNQLCGGSGSIVCCPTSNTITTTPVPIPRIKNTDEIPRRLPTGQEGCGYAHNFYKKIVGGKVSKKGAWPWVALIGYDDDLSASPFKCGGTLVTARHVLTAAHCIRPDLSFVRLGEHDLSTDAEAQHEDIKVVKQVAHPEYNKRNGRSDIALLYLERNVKFTDFIYPICLPNTPELRKKSYVKYTPFVVGWGKTMEGGNSAEILNELQIPIYDNAVCRDRYQKQNRLFSADQFDAAVICAGVLTGGQDTCQGDSGGPLMIPEPFQNSVHFYLIGVVSYGIGCARPEIPGVYTSTQYFIDWITQQVAQTP